MTNGSIPIGEICALKTGATLSRAKKAAAGNEATEAKVLVSSAFESGCILDEEIATERVANVKDELFTREGDVILKTSTPYDCLYIGPEHAGLLVTSFAIILRRRENAGIDMRFLAAFLSMPQQIDALQRLSKGDTVRLLKKKDVELFVVPDITMNEQQRLAAIYLNTLERKNECRNLMRMSDLVLESELTRSIYDR